MWVLNVIFSIPAGKDQTLEGLITRVTTWMIGFAIRKPDWKCELREKPALTPGRVLGAHFFVCWDDMLEGACWEKNSSYVNMVINHVRKEEETSCGLNSAALRSGAEACPEMGQHL